MVILWPGMYTVDSRWRATWSSGEPGCSASPGAAMWMPSVTVPVPRPCTDSASSISVVLESSIENAATLASGRSSGDRRRGQRREAGALGEVVEQEPLPVELVGRVDRAGASAAAPAAPCCVAREASTTALYSGAFLSGLNRMRYSCSRIGAGQLAGGQLARPRRRSAACTCFFFSIAASACCTISAGALRKRPLPARRK